MAHLKYIIEDAEHAESVTPILKDTIQIWSPNATHPVVITLTFYTRKVYRDSRFIVPERVDTGLFKQWEADSNQAPQISNHTLFPWETSYPEHTIENYIIKMHYGPNNKNNSWRLLDSRNSPEFVLEYPWTNTTFSMCNWDIYIHHSGEDLGGKFRRTHPQLHVH